MKIAPAGPLSWEMVSSTDVTPTCMLSATSFPWPWIRAAGESVCAKSTFQLFRAHLVLHDGVRTLFEQSIVEARRAGLLKGGALRVALDTKPILGRGGSGRHV